MQSLGLGLEIKVLVVILVLKKVLITSLPPGTIFELKIHQNAYVARASLRTPLGKLTELPDPLAGFQGAASRQGREGRRKGRRNREGVAFPHFFFSNDCSTVYSCYDIYTVARLSSSIYVYSSVCRHHAD